MIDKRKPSAPGTSSAKPFVVNQPMELMTFLIATLKDKSRTSIKALLAHKMIMVNGLPVKQFNHKLKAGDKVHIGKSSESKAVASMPLEVLFEDDYLIVINKPEGLLTIATESEKEMTAYRMVGDYLKIKQPRARVFVLHRLDRETSGVMMFAKNQEIKLKMQQDWNEDIVNRQYVAVVEGKMKASEGVLDNMLIESTNGMVYVSKAPKMGKRAITRFKLIKGSNDYSMVDLTLETGRKNQIRVQLSHIGFPICGDKKYGAKTNPIKRMALHASTLVFKHPVSGQELLFKTLPPPKFKSLV